MPIQLHNTLTRSKEPFTPRQGSPVGVYACGPTVYQLPHIGNYRTFLFNDLLHRYLEWRGHDVHFVMNLTDVDDRIIEKAAERGVGIDELTAPYIDGFMRELETLGVEPADAYPRATAHIPEMIELVRRLLERGHAYEVEGSVYFDISSFEGYGRLSRVELDRVRTGERVASDRYEKQDVRDFALWKAARDEDHQVGAAWDTPWGVGRPGWHLECSAMSMAQLGGTLDIHTGGEDLVFPHHEDEIAQSEGATGRPFARYWLHAKHLLMDAEKMSKSVGNIVDLQNVLDAGHPPAAVRYLLLSAHYRSELNFSFEALEDARAAVRRLLDFDDRLRATPLAEDASSSGPPVVTGFERAEGAGDAFEGAGALRAELAEPTSRIASPGDSGLREIAERALEGFGAALDDDLNTPEALAALFTFVREANAALDRFDAIPAAERATALEALESIDGVLGVIALARREQGEVEPELAEWVEQMIAERQQARGARDFARADAIRDELAERGIVVEDTARGPRWKKG